MDATTTPTPADVATTYNARRALNMLRTRRANCRKAGYHGPLTRADLAARTSS